MIAGGVAFIVTDVGVKEMSGISTFVYTIPCATGGLATFALLCNIVLFRSLHVLGMPNPLDSPVKRHQKRQVAVVVGVIYNLIFAAADCTMASHLATASGMLLYSSTAALDAARKLAAVSAITAGATVVSDVVHFRQPGNKTKDDHLFVDETDLLVGKSEFRSNSVKDRND
ncbi:uncharacterized protein BKCO1_9300018 [Diplodia corticola]|uniref:Uncharacterized protein n=1 Tax=Diplodia corticola TaxID=236234 RepID=A0A1J9QJP5_9PEZI|nr:uncharacterized protein BKCO1_9300018 [Diplodia corticola]OJD29094.1 hypothetical protein BKCO1_9300018 [Diplodia corticola]